MAKKILDHVVVTYYVSGRPQDPPVVHTYGPYTKSQARRISQKIRDEYEGLVSEHPPVSYGETLEVYPRKIILIPNEL